MNLVRNSGSFVGSIFKPCQWYLVVPSPQRRCYPNWDWPPFLFLSLKNCLSELNALGFILVSVFSVPLEPRPSDDKAFVPVRAGDTESYYLTNNRHYKKNFQLKNVIQVVRTVKKWGRDARTRGRRAYIRGSTCSGSVKREGKTGAAKKPPTYLHIKIVGGAHRVAHTTWNVNKNHDREVWRRGQRDCQSQQSKLVT